MRMHETDIELDGGSLHVYDTGDSGGDTVALWHHGTPNTGLPPEPLRALPGGSGVRWISYDRPGYGSSSTSPDRIVGSAATYASAVADALGIGRFAVVGHSGGASHALACATLLPERVSGVVAISGLAPPDAAGLDWFCGMAASGEASLRAAARGRDAKMDHETSGAEYDPEFVPADFETLSGEWGTWLDMVVGPAVESGPGGLVDDDIAYVSSWGADPSRLAAPAMILHGGRDRTVPPSHAEWLARTCPAAELRLYPDDGHISVLEHAGVALDWLVGTISGRR